MSRDALAYLSRSVAPMWGIQIEEQGGPDVMAWVELPEPVAGPGQVVVELGAAGLNYIDTYQRSGLYTIALPYVLGLEGAGTVIDVGEGVSHLGPGDRVAWATGPGSYAERVAVDADRVMVVPDDIDWEVAATVPLQGMTAHYLACDTFPLSSGDRCLIHAGAGGVGLLLIAALFQLFDGMQTVTTGALRGLGNTHLPMCVNLVGHCAIGLPLAYYLCFVRGWSVHGLWAGLALGLILIGAVLLGVWHRESRLALGR